MRSFYASGILLALLLSSGCSMMGDARVAGRMKNKPAPDFELVALDGGKVRLSSLRGRPVVVAFWAYGCPPCSAEAPHLSRLSEKYAGSGLIILGINAWNEPQPDVARYVKEQRLKHRVLLDGNETFLSYGFTHIPTVLFIRPDGTVADVHHGFDGPTHLEQGIKRLVGG